MRHQKIGLGISLWGGGPGVAVPPWEPADLGFALESGHTGFDVYVVAEGQSEIAGATGLYAASDATDPAYVIQSSPVSDRLLCPNGGIHVLQGVASSSSADLVVDAGQYASLVPAHCNLNTYSKRDFPLMAYGATLLKGLASNHRVVIFQFALGSTSVATRIGGFTGSRFNVTASFSGTTMTVTAVTLTTGGDTTSLIYPKEHLYIVNASLPGGKVQIKQQLTESTPGIPGDLGTYETYETVSAMGPLSCTTEDPPAVQKANGIATATACAALSRAAGKTPIFICGLFGGGTAEQAQASAANFTSTTLPAVQSYFTAVGAAIHGAGVNAAKVPECQILQEQYGVWDLNHSPAANIPPIPSDSTSQASVYPPNESTMGTIAPSTLGETDWCHEVDSSGTRYATNAYQFPRYPSPADTGRNGPHYGPDGTPYIWQGEGAALQFIRRARAGGSVAATHSAPYVTSIDAIWGATTIDATVSKACEINTTLVTNPEEVGVTGKYGVDHYTNDTTRASPSDVTMPNTTTIRVTTGSAGPGGLKEWVSFGGNSKKIVDWSVRDNPGRWPYNNPAGGVSNDGARSCFRHTTPLGASPRTGQQIYEYLALDKKRVRRKAAATGSTVSQMLSGVSLTPDFLLDFNNTSCYSGSGQTITDLSSSAATFNRGLDNSATSTDPTFVAAVTGPPKVPAHFLFDGTQSITPTGTPTFIANLHKDNAAFTFFGLFKMASATPSAVEYLLANCRNESGGGAGIVIRASQTGGLMGLTVRGASNATVLNVNMGQVYAGWNVWCFSLDEATGAGYYFSSRNSRYQLTKGTFTSTYTSPSSSAAEAALQIGRNYRSVDGSAIHLANGSALSVLGIINSHTSEEKLLALWLSLQELAGELESGQ